MSFWRGDNKVNCIDTKKVKPSGDTKEIQGKKFKSDSVKVSSEVRRAVQFNHHFFLVMSPTKSPISNHQIFCFVTKLCCIIANLKCLSQMNYKVHFGDLKQKNWWFEIGDLAGDLTEKFLTRMDGAPNQIRFYKILASIRNKRESALG